MFFLSSQRCILSLVLLRFAVSGGADFDPWPCWWTLVQDYFWSSPLGVGPACRVISRQGRLESSRRGQTWIQVRQLPSQRRRRGQHRLRQHSSFCISFVVTWKCFVAKCSVTYSALEVFNFNVTALHKSSFTYYLLTCASGMRRGSPPQMNVFFCYLSLRRCINYTVTFV